MNGNIRMDVKSSAQCLTRCIFSSKVSYLCLKCKQEWLIIKDTLCEKTEIEEGGGN